MLSRREHPLENKRSGLALIGSSRLPSARGKNHARNDAIEGGGGSGAPLSVAAPASSTLSHHHKIEMTNRVNRFIIEIKPLLMSKQARRRKHRAPAKKQARSKGAPLYR